MRNKAFFLVTVTIMFCLVVSLLALNGCYYHGKTFSIGPVPKEYISIITNIKPFDYPWYGTPSDTTGVYIVSIDGKSVPQPLQHGRVLQEIEVYPGKHVVEARLDCSVRGEEGIKSNEILIFEIETKANKTYLLDAKIDPYLKVWTPKVVDLKEAGIQPRSFM